MSHRGHSGVASKQRDHAPAFAALGDETRLSLLAKLSAGEPSSIARLTEGSGLTRQAITKHLCVLEKTKIVRCTRAGRERLYVLDPQPLTELRGYLDLMSRQWDEKLLRLKAFVEADDTNQDRTA
jgi:DNA-binding transcriptional ArsR family regulator